MQFKNAKELIDLCEKQNKPISEIMVLREQSIFETSRDDIYKKMAYSYKIMKDAVNYSINNDIKSIGGLIGGEAKILNENRKADKSICGTVVSKAVAYAMGVLEVNASMGLIVAAPTAGSSGVIPGVFIALQQEYGLSDDQMISGLFNASAIGYFFMHNATVAGAIAGCQAEVGAASAMAASAMCEIMGGTPRQSLNAASTAISNLLGLVCDPIAGLVESPCQKRNGLGASNALICGEMALAGVNELIPLDEAIEAMYYVGKALPETLRETGDGGIAATPTACNLCRELASIEKN